MEKCLAVFTSTTIDNGIQAFGGRPLVYNVLIAQATIPYSGRHRRQTSCRLHGSDVSRLTTGEWMVNELIAKGLEDPNVDG